MDQGHPTTLLICTVGGSPEPVAAAIRHWRPARVHFVHSVQTKVTADEACCAANFDSGRCDYLELSDAESLERCVDQLAILAPVVAGWASRNGEHDVVVDFTAGTKCMSAAIALHASGWRCRFSYVGGGDRNKSGTGVVISGQEQVRQGVNPWDALGYQAVEEFIVLFDQRSFVAAAHLAESAKKRMTRAARKRELNALEQLASAFDAWERFDHANAAEKFRLVETTGNDLRGVLGHARTERLLAVLEKFAHYLGVLGAPPSDPYVMDLLANARRRRDEDRFDDAVARLYRAIEAMAQVKLKSHGIENTGKVPLAKIPPELRQKWESRAEDSAVPLGLQDAYALLGALNDPLGVKFQSSGLNGATSPLGARNRSILAHGFERVPKDVFDRLWRAALDLADTREQELPSFPKLEA